MGILSHAEKELNLVENKYQSEMKDTVKRVNDHILSIIRIWCDEPLDEPLTSYVCNAIHNICLCKPLTSLTGDDSEWNDVSYNVFQNNRCANVFKQVEDGRSYYLDGFVYQEPGEHGWYTVGVYSRKYITFPCSPSELTTEYRKLIFPTKYVPIKWAVKFHLYRKVK